MKFLASFAPLFLLAAVNVPGPAVGPATLNLTVHLKGTIKPGTSCSMLYVRYQGPSGGTRAVGTGDAAKGICHFTLLSPPGVKAAEAGHLYLGSLAPKNGQAHDPSEQLEIKFAFRQIEWTWTKGGITMTDDWNAPV